MVLDNSNKNNTDSDDDFDFDSLPKEEQDKVKKIIQEMQDLIELPKENSKEQNKNLPKKDKDNQRSR